MVMKAAEETVLTRMKALVAAAIVPYNGTQYRFKAFSMSEVPSLVQLCFQLPRKRMLSEENTEAQIARLMGWVAADNNWPKDEAGEVPISIVTCAWGEYNDDGKPSGRGNWLVRFRVSEKVANYIRDVQQGEIQVQTLTVPVQHRLQAWKGDAKATLVHQTDPPTA